VGEEGVTSIGLLCQTYVLVDTIAQEHQFTEAAQFKQTLCHGRSKLPMARECRVKPIQD
jgi:hypothetical protein